MKIEIRNLSVNSCHGVYEFEKVQPQQFIAHCSLEVDDAALTITDDIATTVSYEGVRLTIIEVLTGESKNTLEYLTDHINRRIISCDPRIQKVTTKIEKTQIFPDCVASVERTRLSEWVIA